MKTLLTLALLAFSLVSLAQLPQLGTGISVLPTIPVYCELGNYATVNWIHDIQKREDTETKAVFEFVVQHGSCFEGERRPKHVNAKWDIVDTLRDDAFWPWQKNFVKTKVFQESPDELRVRLTFDKRKVFAKKRPADFFHLYYLPGEKFGPVRMATNSYGQIYWWQADLRFIWEVTLVLNDRDIVDLKIK